MSKLLKKAAIFAFLAFVILPAFIMAMPVSALTPEEVGIGDDQAAASIGLGNETPADMAVNIIKVILGFLGLIAVVIILIGGFKWMTAAGNEDKVGEAKKLITAGIIGLVIILAAWGITSYVITTLMEITN